MSEESARIYNRARRNGISSAEAWEDLQSISEDIDWDVERMLSESPQSTDADRETGNVDLAELSYEGFDVGYE